MIRKVLKTFLSFFIIIILSGCWNQIELDNLAFVVAIGIDKEDDKIRITYVITNPEFGTQPEAASDAPPFQLFSFVAEDLLIAESIANTIISKQISYYILNTMFISEEFARTDEFIHWLYDTTKITEIRKDLDMVITKEDTFDYLEKFHPKIEKKPFKFLRTMTESNTKSAFIPSDSELFRFLQVTESGKNLYLAIMSTNEEVKESSHNKYAYNKGNIDIRGSVNNTQFLGSAVFKDGKMIGQLTEQETILSTILNAKLRGDQDIFKSFIDPFNDKYNITTRMNIYKKAIVSLNLTDDNPSIDVNVPLIIDVLTNQSLIDYEKKNNREKLKKYLENYLENEFNDLIKKSQEELGGDPFGWSLYARKYFTTNEQLDNFDWEESFLKMNVNVKVDVVLNSFGRQPGTLKIKKLRGNK